ncbi:hypothetical protein BJX65DRAFT_287234 [Aspergillus insuetus]
MLRTTRKHNLHFIIDGIYAFSVFLKPAISSSTFSCVYMLTLIPIDIHQLVLELR